MSWAKETLECLKQNPETRYTSREIATWIVHNLDYKRKIDKKRESAKQNLDTDEKLIGQVSREISAKHRDEIIKKYPHIKSTEDRPRQFYYSESMDDDSDEPDSLTTKQDDTKIKEHELYPKLTEFLWSELEINSKRIDERQSSNKGGVNANKWLYPDLVGVENLGRGWKEEIKKVATAHADKKAKLWSFEVKVEIKSSNVRESFFQAVSNSSWANYAYLVASSISTSNSERVMKELRILSSLHGVGVILLNYENPAESEIKIPAQERPTIDWNVANRLAESSKDFAKYVEAVLAFYQTGKIHPAFWDKIESP